MKRQFITLIIAFFAVANCFGWGQKGHDVVAYIAEKHLRPEVLAHLDSVFQRRSIVYYSNWLDNASHTNEFAFTKTWHYKNIDADQTYESAPNERRGNVVSAINDQISTLQGGGLTLEQEQFALMVLVHLMGDLHQPMHMGRLSDLGGNLHEVKMFGRKSKLHSVWDSNLVESAHKWSYTEWQSQIDRETPEFEAQAVSGTVNDWGKETYQIATAVYNATPIGTNISYDYVAEWTPVIELQLLRGGLRLAHVLNSIYGGK